MHEMKHGLGWKRQQPNYQDYKFEEVVKVTAPPPSADITNLVSAVRDQGQLGACTSFGTLAAFEALQIKRNGKMQFPGCHLLEYRNTRILDDDFPGDNGGTIRNAVKATVKYGVAPETDWPYNIANFDKTPPAQAVIDAVKDESTNYYLLDSSQGHAQTLYNIEYAIGVTGLPPVYGTPVYSQFENVTSNGIISAPKGKSIGGHCMAFFGYDSKYLWTLNSWGEGWGKAFRSFKGGLGLLPKVYVTKGLVSDVWVVSGEAELTANQ